MKLLPTQVEKLMALYETSKLSTIIMDLIIYHRSTDFIDYIYNGGHFKCSNDYFYITKILYKTKEFKVG